jgi:hypothetical protein
VTQQVIVEHTFENVAAQHTKAHFFLLVFVFWWYWRVWTQGLVLASLAYYCLNYAYRPFLALFILRVGSCIFCWVDLGHCPSVYAACIGGTIGAHHHAQLIGWDGISLTFSPGWSPTLIIWSSCSRIAGITGVNHYAWSLKHISYWNIDDTGEEERALWVLPTEIHPLCHGLCHLPLT